MVGLEIDLDLMTERCGSNPAVWLHGGLCIAGVFTLLVPIKVSNEDRECLQWHLMYVKPSKPTDEEKIDMREELWRLWEETESEERLILHDLNDLSKFKRHFLERIDNYARDVDTKL